MGGADRRLRKQETLMEGSEGLVRRVLSPRVVWNSGRQM